MITFLILKNYNNKFPYFSNFRLLNPIMALNLILHSLKLIKKSDMAFHQLG